MIGHRRPRTQHWIERAKSKIEGKIFQLALLADPAVHSFPSSPKQPQLRQKHESSVIFFLAVYQVCTLVAYRERQRPSSPTLCSCTSDFTSLDPKLKQLCLI